MTLHTPLWMQAAEGDTEIEYSANLDRLLVTSLWATEGVISPSSLKVTQRGAGANMSVDVASGTAIITGNDVAQQGTYTVVSDAVENVTVPAAPASGTRVHRVVAWVKDKLHDGTQTTYEWTIELLEDTGGGTPALPDSAINLATVSVSAAQTSVEDSHITDIRISALTRSSRPHRIDSASVRPAVPLEGERIYRTDLDCDEISDGSSWFEVPRRDGGGSAWSTYTPSLTATSSSPTLGSGSTAQGRYIRYGRTVTAEVIVKFGTSGAAAGNGFYEVSLPVTARTQTIGRRSGSGWAYDNSANDFADGIAFINSGETTKVRLSIDSNVVGHSVPWAWGASDELGFTITYEAAS